MSVQTESRRFAYVVRETLLDNKLAGRKPDSIRGLARAMAKGDQRRFETYKRSLFKWMKPGEPYPSPESRALVAAALGVERSELSDDDPVADLSAHAVAVALEQDLKKTSPPPDLAVLAGTGSEPEGA